MNIREKQEHKEQQDYSIYASLSMNSRGRAKMEEECDIRTCYQRDRDRILHCKAFRRLKDKTQVFMSPKGDHYRTRLTHTLEVSQTARTIARALDLNETLTEAIALGHDLGHTPFGHAGEYALNRLSSTGFKHYEQSIRVVEFLEKDGRGLNLTYEVKDGIRNHSTINMPETMEGKIVRLSDKIAYINHDIDDAIRGKILTEDDLPKEETAVLGHTVRERINTMIRGIIRASEEKDDIIMEPDRLFIDEAVVTALGIKKSEKSLGYSIQQVSSEAFKKVKTDNPLNVLNGKVAGLTLNTRAGILEDPPVKLRGESPIYVVNGTPVKFVPRSFLI